MKEIKNIHFINYTKILITLLLFASRPRLRREIFVQRVFRKVIDLLCEHKSKLDYSIICQEFQTKAG